MKTNSNGDNEIKLVDSQSLGEDKKAGYRPKRRRSERDRGSLVPLIRWPVRLVIQNGGLLVHTRKSKQSAKMESSGAVPTGSNLIFTAHYIGPSLSNYVLRCQMRGIA